jgi:hypothetical protein
MSKWYPTSAICGCGYDFDIQRSGFAAAYLCGCFGVLARMVGSPSRAPRRGRSDWVLYFKHVFSVKKLVVVFK